MIVKREKKIPLSKGEDSPSPARARGRKAPHLLSAKKSEKRRIARKTISPRLLRQGGGKTQRGNAAKKKIRVNSLGGNKGKN